MYNRLYVEDIATWSEYCNYDYFIDEPLETQVVNNGVILPLKDLPEIDMWVGGVCDANAKFVAGHKRTFPDDNIIKSCTCAYPINEHEQTINETIVYGGLILNNTVT